MARAVYFAFDYEDVKAFRANVVRKSSVVSKRKFKDSSIWEESKEKGVKKIKELIDNSLVGTSVTCVLIGSGTYNRRYVRYEIVKSFTMNKGLLGVGINWIKDKNGNTKFWAGNNPFEHLRLSISKDGSVIYFYEHNNGWIKYIDLPEIRNTQFTEKDYGKTFKFNHFFDVYSYDWDNGKKNFVDWVDEAAKKAGR